MFAHLHPRWPAWIALLALLAGLVVGPAPAVQAQTPVSTCALTSPVAALATQSQLDDWAGWIAALSGAQEVLIDGQPARILTRYTPAMFSAQANAQAYQYVRQQLLQWYPAGQLEDHTYRFDGQTWKNLVLTLPGIRHPNEVVILSAHLDSMSEQPASLAPGASDNATGAAALLEAARIFRNAHFDRTLRLIFFTGEEQGKVGSHAYVRDRDLQGVVGVFNLDMFGYDGDGDRCFELHVGTLPASAPLGRCFQAALQLFQPGLAVDYLDGYDLRFSDHASFWEAGVGALEVLENYSYNPSENGCLGLRDRNPNYHRSTDTIDHLDLPTGFAIQQAALAAVAAMAQPAGQRTAASLDRYQPPILRQH
jgi:hypothetical protein